MQDVTQTLKETLDSNYFFLDLEVNSLKKIYRIGLLSQKTSLDVFVENFSVAAQELNNCYQQGLSICGHNFRRFDYDYLIEQHPHFQSWLIIDTLELSVLAFPLLASHKLNKQYKQHEYSSNNPLEDARATELLLYQILDCLSQKPPELFSAYRCLLTCGNDLADQAYQRLFKNLEISAGEIPLSNELPNEALIGFNQNYLEKFFQESSHKSFDSRLCMAGLLAWNYERNITQSAHAYSGWLSHLPRFAEVLDGLSPLFEEGLTYDHYLQRFNIEGFREQQEETVQTILNHQNPLVLMPTGGGKSLCYQLPALMLFERQRGLTVVISPLQALMADQVADLENEGLNFATFINANLTASERRNRLEQLLDGKLGLLYISPEQLRSISIRSLFEERPPALWVIDEAHCISQWGHDFRPDYRYIPKFIGELYQERPLPRLALMTATATVAVCKDIKQLFSQDKSKQKEFSIQKQIISENTRKNLNYSVIYPQDSKESLIINEVQKCLAQDGCVLVYTTTRKNAEKLANLLNQTEIEARYYHGKIFKVDKEEILEAFKSGDLNVVVATCAFGMGINRKDVRAVIHHTMSANLENYIQESGRAGRDGEAAECTLLFEPDDAETIFFLQSLNQLSETDLKNIFIATRSIRDRLSREKVLEDWFWITTNEIYQASDLDEEFANEDDQRDTKMKVALYHLENFGLVDRAENLSTFIQFELIYATSQQSLAHLAQYNQIGGLPFAQIEKLKQLITAMHIVKSFYNHSQESIPIERLSDESGIEIKQLKRNLSYLEKAGICTFKLPLSLLITKGVTGDALKNHQRLRDLEEKLLDTILELQNENNIIQINLRGLASRLDPNREQKIRAATLKALIDGWTQQGWVDVTVQGRDVIRLKNLNLNVTDYLEKHTAITSTIIKFLYTKLSEKTGARLQVEYEITRLLNDVTQQVQQIQIEVEEKALEKALLWLHSQKLIRITEGLNLFHQALKIQVKKGARIDRINKKSYQTQVKAFYDQQARRTHIMIHYSKLEDALTRQQLVQHYFSLSPEEFEQRYPALASDSMTLPVIQEDYHRILDGLNTVQKNIVLSESNAIAVIAGPGSGKTRTIVHRIAYLVKVKRVDPNRIIVLAYNRNAVRELKIRLQYLVGSLASRLRVFTFHGLALALLGRTLGELRRAGEDAFQKLIEEACDLLESGDELDDEDSQARRVQLLGNTEYIFVDEYQDVAEDEYRMIKLIAGLGDTEENDQSNEKSRSVQINLCVIGDDDQNIYEFRRTSPQYIIQFEAEYQAEKFLLTENYRSTENIIETANCLIEHNQNRCKQTPEQQVRINTSRLGHKGHPVTSLLFSNQSQQAGWITEKIKSWLSSGIKPNEIAVLARQWDNLSPVRLLLDNKNIPTYALKNNGIKLVRNGVTCLLINELQQKNNSILNPEESVQQEFQIFFQGIYENLEQPTVKTLLKIAKDLDEERGYGSEDLALPISIDEILTAIFEFNESGETFLEEDAVLVTSCHGAKGLEFRKVILITDGFTTDPQQIQSERRLCYVAMTRAKEELILCSTSSSLFLQEAGLIPEAISYSEEQLPQLMRYLDLTPADVNLGYRATKNNQAIISTLSEGMPLCLKTNSWGDGWSIFTSNNQEIGSLSRRGTQSLTNRGIHPGHFQFQLDEVTVRSIYRHLKIDEVTGNILEDWFVVIPQIRICRY